MVAVDELNAFAEHLAAEVRNRHPGGFNGARTCQIGIWACHISKHGHFDHVVGNRPGFGRIALTGGLTGTECKQARKENEKKLCFLILLLVE